MMKREKAQNKKWLWIVLALVALLAVAGIAVALLLPGGTQQEAPTGPAVLYWNVDRLANLEEETGMSIRTKGEDGLFHIRFAIDGQQVELPVTGDKQLVNYIDTMDVMGLVMDGDGIVVDAVEPKQIADETAKDFFVRKVDGDKLIVNSSMAMNGMETEITLSADTGIYDVDPDAEVVGQPGTPQIMDRVSVYSDMGTQNVTHVFLTEHPEDAEIFWRVEKCWDSKTSKTTREPDENGVYTLQMAHGGELVELKTKDVAMVNAIDGQSDYQGQCALQVDEEGYIVGKVDFTTALRGTYLASEFWITAIEGDAYTATKLSGSDNGKTVSFTVPEGCEIYQCCVNGCYEHNCGERTDHLQLRDRVNVFADLDGNVTLIFINSRAVDSPMYYNFERQNGSDGTTRKADKNGYYRFELLADGKIVTVRAPKELADQMDAIYNGCMGLKLNGDIVERVYNGNCVSGYYNAGAYSIVQSISGAVVSLAASSSDYVWNKLLSPDCVVYNAITGEYGAKIGGTTTLQVGDTVNAYRDIYDQISIVFVTARYAEGAKVYYNLNRSYNSTQKETTRTPDADGYYVFEMVCEGKPVTVKTKSKGMASFIDEQLAPLVGLKVNGSGVITNAYIVTSALKGQGKVCNYRYVENVTKTTFNTFYYPAATPDVKKVDPDTYTLADDCVIYNVSLTYSKYRGEKSTLKNGDYIQAIWDLQTKKITQIYIMQRDPTYGVSSYKANCSHCGKTVTWTPYNGRIAAEGGHYFMCADIAHNSVSIGKKDGDKNVEVVLDLKGYTLTGTSRVFMVYSKLTVMDTKGGGKIVGTSTGGGLAGASVFVYNGGQLDLKGGELTLSKNSTAYGTVGGVLYIGEKSVVNMSGGKITGGIASASGGNIVSYGGTFNMTGGTVEGGTAPAGANMYFTRTKVNISGGNVGGGIYALNTCEVTLSGAPVISGTGLEITPGMKISVDKLTKGASIVLCGDGIFTNALTNPESYLAYFKTANEGDSITIEGSALKYYRKPADYNSVDNSNLAFASGTTNAYCPVCKETVSWTAIAAETQTLASGKHYYLSQDISYNGSNELIKVPSSGKVCVHLNGHSVTSSANRVFQGNGCTLNIMGNGTVTGGWVIPGSYILGGAVGINTSVAGGTINLIGGTYMSTTTAPVVAVSNNGGKINMYAGATIRGDSDTRSVYVGAAELINADFNVYGGKIEGGSVYMTGNNTAKGNATSMTISGGTITGGVEISANSTLILSGAPVISGEPLRIPAKVKLTLGELTQNASILVSADGVFTEANEKAADYAVYFKPANPETDMITVQDNALCYTKPQKDASEVNKNLEFATGTTTALCPICEKEVSWTALTETNAAVKLSGGTHYYLTGDLTFNENDMFLTAPGTGMVSCLHLNGHNITATKNRVLQGSAGVVNIMGNGTVSGNFSASGSWNIVAGATIGINTNVANGAINLYGGTYVKAASNTTHAIVAVAPNGGIINMYEGATIDGTGLTGPNVSVCNGFFNMYGGKILGGSGNSVNIISGPTSKSGTFVMEDGQISGCSGNNLHIGGIAAAPAKVTVSGGTIAGDITVDVNSQVTLSGTPVITMGTTTGLKLADGVKLTLADLAKDAEIVVSANGVFTQPCDNAAAYAESFKPAAENDQIVVQENVLSYTKAEQGGDDTGDDDTGDDDGPTVENEYTKDLVFDEGTTDAVCPACGEKKTWTAISDNAAPGSGVAADGHYYLTADVVNTSGLNYMQVNGKSVCLHLNGHDLTYAGRIHLTNASNTSMLNIMGKGVVKSTATASADYGTIIVNGGASVVNLYGGTYRYEGTAYAPIAVDQKTATVNMYEGAAVKGVGTVGVLANKGFFNMYGGTVTGGISAVTGTVTLGGASTVDSISVATGGKLVVKADFTGTACATFAALTNNTIPEANGTSEGAYTGKLYLNELESQLIIGKDGKLVIEGSGDDSGDGDQTEENVYTKDLVFDEGTTDAVCPVCGEKKTWTAISDNAAPGSGVAADGHYYLTADVVNTSGLNYMQVNGKNVCLHLNGHDLTYAGRIHLTNGTGKTSKLNIMGNGTVKSTATASADYGTIIVNGGASVVNLYGGTYQYEGTAYAPITVDQKTATVNMYEGATVKGDGTFGVLANKGYFNMYGGTVTGGISAVTGTVTLGGASTVDSITVAETGKLVVKADFTGTASASFATLTNEVIPEANGASEGAYTGTLHLNKNNRLVIVGKDGRLVIENGFNNSDLVFDEGTTNAVCPVCGEKKTWTAVTNNDGLGTKNDGGHHHLYLTKDVTNTGAANYLMVNGAKVCLHLNGYNITYGSRIFVTNGSGKTSTLNIMGNGTVKSTGTHSTNDTGTINVAGGASVVNLYGGTYQYGDTAYAPIRLSAKNATVNMYEGATAEGTDTVGVMVQSGIFNLLGGRVYGGLNAAGGSVTLDSVAIVTGKDGALVGNIAISETAKLIVSDGFIGAASVSFAALTDNTIPEANGVSQGAYTGKLYLEIAGTPAIVAKDGKLVLAAN